MLKINLRLSVREDIKKELKKLGAIAIGRLVGKAINIPQDKHVVVTVGVSGGWGGVVTYVQMRRGDKKLSLYLKLAISVSVAGYYIFHRDRVGS